MHVSIVCIHFVYKNLFIVCIVEQTELGYCTPTSVQCRSIVVIIQVQLQSHTAQVWRLFHQVEDIQVVQIQHPALVVLQQQQSLTVIDHHPVCLNVQVIRPLRQPFNYNQNVYIVLQ